MPQEHRGRRGTPLDIDAGNDRRYRVYVLRLGNGDLYVGSTGKTFRQRFEDHCKPSHHQPAQPVAKYGAKKLETALCIKKSYASRSAAVRAERRLAERLRGSLAKAGKATQVHQG